MADAPSSVADVLGPPPAQAAQSVESVLGPKPSSVQDILGVKKGTIKDIPAVAYGAGRGAEDALEKADVGDKVKIPWTVHEGGEAIYKHVTKIGDGEFTYEPDKTESSIGGAFGRDVLNRIPGAAAGVAAMGAAQPILSQLDQLGTVGKFAHGAGTLIAGIGGAAGMQNLTQGNPVGFSKEQVDADQAQHPQVGAVADVAANLPFFRPGIATGTLTQKILSHAVPAAIGGGLQAGQEMVNPQQGALGRIALAAGVNGLMNTPTGLGNSMMGAHSIVEAADVASKHQDASSANAQANAIATKPGAGSPLVDPTTAVAPTDEAKPNIETVDRTVPEVAAKPTPKFWKNEDGTIARRAPIQADIEKSLGLDAQAPLPEIIDRRRAIMDAMDAADSAKKFADQIQKSNDPAQLQLRKKAIQGLVGDQVAGRAQVDPAQSTVLADMLRGEAHKPTGEPDNPETGPTMGDLLGLNVTYNGVKGQLAKGDDGAFVVIPHAREAGSPVREIEVQNADGETSPKGLDTPVKLVGDQGKGGLYATGGFINPSLLYHLGAPVVGAVIGYQTGDTPEAKMKNAIMGALLASGGTLASHAAAHLVDANPRLLDRVTMEAHKFISDPTANAFDNLTGKTDANPEQSPVGILNVEQAGNGQTVAEGGSGGVQEITPKKIAEARPYKTPEQVADEVRYSPEYRKQVTSQVKKIFNRSQDSPSVDIFQKAAQQQALAESTGVSIDQLHKLTQEDLPINVLEALRDKIGNQEYLGRVGVKGRQVEFEAEKALHLNDMAGSAASPINDTPSARSPGERLSLPERMGQAIGNGYSKAMDFAANTGRALLHRDIVLDNLDGNQAYRGFLSRVFGGKIDLAYNADRVLRDEWKAPLREAAKGLDATSMERVAIHEIAHEENGLARLQDSQVDPKTIQKILKEGLTDKEQKYADTWHDVRDKMLPVLAGVVHNENNIALAPVDNYFPFQRDWSMYHEGPAAREQGVDNGSEAGMDNLLKNIQKDAFTPRTSTKPNEGMTIERQPDAKGAVKLNAAQILDNHINASAHLATHLRDVKMLGQLARTPTFTAKYGTLGQEYVMNLLDTVSRDGGFAGDKKSAWMDWLRNNSSVGVLGLRVLSQAKHAPNAAIALAEVGPNFMAKGVSEAFTAKGSKFISDNFHEIKERAGGEQSIADLGEGPIGKAKKGAFALERGIDALDARSTVMGAYLKELAKKGIDPATYTDIPVDKEAQRMALVTARKVVTSPLAKDAPQAISRAQLSFGSSTLAKTLFQFQNTMLRQAGYLKHDVYDLGVKNMDPAQFGKAALGFLGMLAGETAIQRANKSLLGKPDKSDAAHGFPEDMALELTKRLPFAGNIVSAAEYGETGMPLADLGVSTVHKLGELAGIAKDNGGRPLSNLQGKRTAVDVGTNVLSALGVPGAATAGQLIKNHYLATPGATPTGRIKMPSVRAQPQK